jgi:hypothetical protein
MTATLNQAAGAHETQVSSFLLVLPNSLSYRIDSISVLVLQDIDGINASGKYAKISVFPFLHCKGF